MAQFTIQKTDFDLGEETLVLQKVGVYSENWYMENTYLEYTVEVENKNKDKKAFNIVFQDEERTNGMKGYSCYGVDFGGKFGCESDESSELDKWLEDADEYELMGEINEELEKMALKDAKKKYDKLMKEKELVRLS